MHARRAIFLDRDGVLNRAIERDGKPYPPESVSDLELLPGVEKACRDLQALGYMLIVVTNQPDISRGTKSTDSVDAINRQLSDRLPLDAIRICPHDDADNCHCRKPRPGLLLDAARDFGIDLSASFMIGDRWRDIEAGAGAGCRTVWIRYPWREKQPAHADFIAPSLLDAAAQIAAVKEHS